MVLAFQNSYLRSSNMVLQKHVKTGLNRSEEKLSVGLSLTTNFGSCHKPR